MILVYSSTGVLREKWDHVAQVVTFYDTSGVQTSQQGYTAEEKIWGDEELADQARWEESVRMSEAEEALIKASIELAPAPTTSGAWAQPTGAQDAYAKESVVEHAGKTWVSLTPFNVWEPGVSSWREQVAEGYPAWIQPTGAQDAYPMNARVSHNGQDWENTGSDANVWEPGVFGWVVIP